MERHAGPERGAVRVSLITEATYPYHLGGVSVWCDQMVHGLAPHTFDIVAIGAGDERLRWALPPNVHRLQPVPLWHATAAGRGRVSRSTIGAFGRLLAAMDGPEGQPAFEEALRELFEHAQCQELGPALRTPDALELVLATMGPTLPPGRPTGVRPAPGSLDDAVGALALLEHFLRPLAAAVPEADLSHSSANGLGLLPALAAQWRYGTPMVVTEHGVYLRERYLSLRADHYPHQVRTLLLRFFRHLNALGYRRADAIAPGSRYNRRWEEATGADPGRIRLIHNGVDVGLFPEADSEPAEPVLTWVGRIDPLKDVETMLRAFAEVRSMVPGARLRLFGPTPRGNEPYREQCLRLHRELDLGDDAVFEGHVPSVLTAYGAGQVFVMTSISEGFPYVLLEAMAVGRPTVTTAVGGCAEVAGHAGVVVPPRDPSAVAAACAALLTDTDRRRQLGQAARSRVLSRFTLDQCLDRYRELYQDLAGGWGDVPTEPPAAPASTGSPTVAAAPPAVAAGARAANRVAPGPSAAPATTPAPDGLSTDLQVSVWSPPPPSGYAATPMPTVPRRPTLDGDDPVRQEPVGDRPGSRWRSGPRDPLDALLRAVLLKRPGWPEARCHPRLPPPLPPTSARTRRALSPRAPRGRR